ncbi:MAG TPA: hypothetical protein DCK93_05125 [Blastocatellia bacterium]|jgi:hypothetical protein|nr:hypothetical protein [Blastocatellia bacterium]
MIVTCDLTKQKLTLSAGLSLATEATGGALISNSILDTCSASHATFYLAIDKLKRFTKPLETWPGGDQMSV